MTNQMSKPKSTHDGCAAYWAIKAHYYRRLADQIMSAEKTMALNQPTFHKQAAADAPIHLARSDHERGLGGEAAGGGKTPHPPVTCKSPRRAKKQRA
jgi:hypothetical protein